MTEGSSSGALLSCRGLRRNKPSMPPSVAKSGLWSQELGYHLRCGEGGEFRGSRLSSARVGNPSAQVAALPRLRLKLFWSYATAQD